MSANQWVPPLQRDAMPRHIAIIMDGNGRWAEAKGLPRAMGHAAGVEALRRTVEAAIKVDLPYLTIYSFSSENWTRPETEIDELMKLMKLYVATDLSKLHANNVRIRIIGDRDNLSNDLQRLLEQVESTTCNNTGLNLIVAFNYGARQELVQCIKKIYQDIDNNQIKQSDINQDLVASYLYTADIPDPDMLIRTSGEMRLSNFLLWQLAYAEFVFTQVLWPDFTEADLLQCVEIFKKRERRFGGLSSLSSDMSEKTA